MKTALIFTGYYAVGFLSFLIITPVIGTIACMFGVHKDMAGFVGFFGGILGMIFCLVLYLERTMK